MRQIAPSSIFKIFAQTGWHQIALYLFLSTIITACSTYDINVKPDQVLEPEEGILVFRFHPINDKGSKSSATFTLKIRKVGKGYWNKDIKVTEADNLRVVSLPAGEYRWHSLHIAQYHADFTEDDGFVVQAGKMVYVGDVYCRHRIWLLGIKSSIAVQDKYDEVLKRLNVEYPSMVEKYGLSKSLTTMKYK